MRPVWYSVFSDVVSAVVSGRRNAFAPNVVMNMPAQSASAAALAGVQGRIVDSLVDMFFASVSAATCRLAASSVPIAVGWRNGNALLLRSSDSPGTSSSLQRRVVEQIADRGEVLARGQAPERHDAGGVGIGRDRRRSAGPGQAAFRRRCRAARRRPAGLAADRAVAAGAQKDRAAGGQRVSGSVRPVMMFAPSKRRFRRDERAPPPKATYTYITVAAP